MLTTVNLFEKLDRDLNGVEVAIQGFGKVGTAAARLLEEKGCKIVAISDISGGIYAKDGLDIKDAVEFVDGGKNLLKDYEAEGFERIDNEELLTLDVDVLIPAAVENEVTKEIAEKTEADIIVEAANGPTTTEADEVLKERDILVIPDILANAGGVTVSYFEWVQNKDSFKWEDDEVRTKLKRVMTNAFNNVWETHKKENVTPRMAAYMIALDRIIETKNLRGVFP